VAPAGATGGPRRGVPPGSMVSQAGAVTAPEVAEGRIPNDAELWRAFGI